MRRIVIAGLVGALALSVTACTQQAESATSVQQAVATTQDQAAEKSAARAAEEQAAGKSAAEKSAAAKASADKAAADKAAADKAAADKAAEEQSTAASAADSKSVDTSEYRFGVGSSLAFVTPSGNLSCLMDPDVSEWNPATFSTTCYAEEHDWPGDPRPDYSVCPETWSWVTSFVALMKEGVSAGICTGDSPVYGAEKVLAYGTSITTGTITCSSAETGVTCADTALGNGFTVSRSTLTRDGPTPTWANDTSERSSGVMETEIIHVKPTDDAGNLLPEFTVDPEVVEASAGGPESEMDPSPFGGSAFRVGAMVPGSQLNTCWPSSTSQEAYCMFDAEDQTVIAIHTELPFVEPVADLDPEVRPWRIQLDDDSTCDARTHGSLSLRLTYVCSSPDPGKGVNGTVSQPDKTGAVWTIQQVDGVDTVDEISDRENPPTRTAEIVKAWMAG